MSDVLSIDALQDAVGRGPDDALSATRRDAVDALRKQGLPEHRDEDWKYTDLRPLYELSNAWLANSNPWLPTSPTVDVAMEAVADLDADWIVFKNGAPDIETIRSMQLAGVRLHPLSTSGEVASIDMPLAQLNLALLHDGLCIDVSSDRAGQRPLGILHVNEAPVSGQAHVTNSRIDFNVAAGASANIVEAYVASSAGELAVNSVTNITLGESARLNLVRLQTLAPDQSLTTSTLISPSAQSRVDLAGFDLGGKLVRNDIVADIRYADADVRMSGLYLTDDRQHVDNHIRMDHRTGPARSEQTYRGILAGRSRAVWNGKAVVHAGADGTDANQANHNILLSRKAEVDTKPELEIYADDVRCSHGTTVGALDERALFYLRSRGLNQAQARALLMRAFAQEIVQRSPVASIEEAISDRVAERVANLIDGESDDA